MDTPTPGNSFQGFSPLQPFGFYPYPITENIPQAPIPETASGSTFQEIPISNSMAGNLPPELAGNIPFNTPTPFNLYQFMQSNRSNEMNPNHSNEMNSNRRYYQSPSNGPSNGPSNVQMDVPMDVDGPSTNTMNKNGSDNRKSRKSRKRKFDIIDEVDETK